MPRRARLSLPNVPLHIIQRGNNRQPCFYVDSDYRCYLKWLAEASVAAGCAIHAYVLMTNHVHMLVSEQAPKAAGAMMKALGQRYVQFINRKYQRSGTLWEGRFRSCLTQEDGYFLTCQRYIELNPVRAGMVNHPADYPWSSYLTNAHGRASPLISAHRLYGALGGNSAQRQAAYRELFRHALPQGQVEAIRRATNGNFALGDTDFVERMADALGRRVTPALAGRPRRE